MPIFKRRSKTSPADDKLTESFSLAVLSNAQEQHQHKLRSEIRICPTCSYRVVNPMTDRCPRCFSAVPLSEHTNCGECDYKGNCALAEIDRHRAARGKAG